MALRAGRTGEITNVIYSAHPLPCRHPFVPGIACDSHAAFRIPCRRHGEGRSHQPGDGGYGLVRAGRPRRRRGAFRGTPGGSRTRSSGSAAEVRRVPRRSAQDGGGAQSAHWGTGRDPTGAGGALPSRPEPPRHQVGPFRARRTSASSLWWNPGERRERRVLPVGARRPADKAREGGAPTGRTGPSVFRPKRNAERRKAPVLPVGGRFRRDGSPLERRLGFATGCWERRPVLPVGPFRPASLLAGERNSPCPTPSSRVQLRGWFRAETPVATPRMAPHKINSHRHSPHRAAGPGAPPVLPVGAFRPASRPAGWERWAVLPVGPFRPASLLAGERNSRCPTPSSRVQLRGWFRAETPVATPRMAPHKMNFRRPSRCP